MTAPAAFAAQVDDDQVSQITVQASQKVKTKQVGVSYRGLPGSDNHCRRQAHREPSSNPRHRWPQIRPGHRD
jgi:hypothetical protein